jgi:hypothetical protein
VHAAKPCGKRDSTLKVPENRDQATIRADEEALACEASSFETRIGKNHMPLIQLLEVLIVVGVLLWLVNRFIPMQSSIKSILNGVVVIAVVLWLLNVFGLFHSLSRVRIGT